MASSTKRAWTFLMGCLLAAVAVDTGCRKARGPNTSQPEDQLLFEWGGVVASGDREEALKLYDLELRQKLQFWDSDMRPLNDPNKQMTVLQAALPRLGEAAALTTVGAEAWNEVKDQPWIKEVAEGKCVSGVPSKDDIGRGVVPKERKEMGQELGMWVFELRNAIGWAPAFRVNCPSGESFWVQMARRKKIDPNGAELPLKIIRVGR
jgi:hypothetical protein